MSGSVNILERIIIAPPMSAIYQRLGFRKKATQISDALRRETDRHIEEANSLITLKGLYLRLAVDANDGQRVVLEGDVSFASAKLADFLGGCREVVLMGATAGSPVMDAIREKTLRQEMTAAVVYDATASEMADAALDWITGFVNRQIRREGKSLLPRRFSAGYGDFELENQKAIFDKLRMDKIGVALSERFVLIPEKSVTAISGIRPIS
jgi:hypothetical protein